ncbi:MAG: amidase [Solirubrobacterales bacterium]|nr:amidase [Solirubrobacterales bacterium]MBV9048688.1 amidase [Solirubrobacterales bacterium]
MSELLSRPALELGMLVRSGELTGRELVEASLRRIDELDPTINAFTHVAYEDALAAADQIVTGDSRPFAGVPIAIKDNRPVAGMPLTMCSDLFGELVPDYDAFVVRRLREAGFVIVGKTTLPEMGILPTTEPRRFGATRNPWSLDRTPGGSSGGSGAAVSAGMVPVAHGNDGGGSIRIPAACCGLVGLKCARGRVSAGPDSGHSFLATDGVLTRTVADTAQLLDVIAGYELGDASWSPLPDRGYAELAERDPGPMRIGLALGSPLPDAHLDPICERAARDGAEVLESLGHRLEEITPPWSDADVLPDFTRLFGPAVSTTTAAGGRLIGREPTERDVEPLTWALFEHARTEGTLKYLEARGRVEAFARSIVAFLAPFDVVVTPALAQRPLRTGEVHGRGPDPWDHFDRSGLFTPYTAICNVTGLPALSVPLYHGEDGLPAAVQLIGPPAREEVLLQLASQLERALPWAERLPTLARP